jgi:translation initiation factor 2B subunit (eIF-2B alpha/beta/delta family)
VDAKIAEKINRIAGDTTHGASWLTKQAIGILNLTARESRAQTIGEFVDEIRQVTLAVAKARPSMVSLANYANFFLAQILEAREQKDLPALKSYALTKGLELAKNSKQAFSKTIEYASSIIKDTDTVATCSYSSTVCQVLEVAKRKGTSFQVIIAQSSFGNTNYGDILAAELATCSIPTQIIADKDIHRQIARATKALIGADTITADGNLINGTPSLALARASRTKQVPLFVVCETSKFDFFGYTSAFREPGFDNIPLDMCTAVITEKGTMRPELVTTYIQQKTEEMTRLLQGDKLVLKDTIDQKPAG